MILNNEQLRQQARELALTHTPTRGSRGAAAALIAKFEEQCKFLRRYAGELQQTHEAGLRPAEEWLLDHADYMAEQAILIRRAFRKSRAHRLHVIRETRDLRVAAICADYLSHVDGLLHVDPFLDYVNAYQEIAVLTIAEASILPLFLRITLIGRLADVMRRVQERRGAGREVDRLLAPLGNDPLSAAKVREALDRSGETMPLSGPVVVQLARRLGEVADHAGEVREWLRCRLDNESESLERIVAYEHRLQASYEVTAGHAIGSLRQIERVEWSDSFEKLCLADRILREEESGSYPMMDAVSRSVLLGRVETLAKRMNVPETLAARQAVELADRYGQQSEQASEAAIDESSSSDQPHGAAPLRQSLAAYYLLDPNGNRALWRALKECSDPRAMPRAAIKRERRAVYFGALALSFGAALLIAAWAAAPSDGYGALPPAGIAAILLLLTVPASEWAVQGLHWAICRYCDSRPLLRFDYASGVPEEATTIVVIPVIWSRPEQVREMAERLELHYLANRDPNIHYALLGDFRDAAAEKLPEDRAVLDAMRAAVEALNEAYGNGQGGTRFLALQRRRQWNQVEGVWMGWERKRGKLVEFAELLRGKAATSYAHQYGDTSVLPSIRYVITLDADTQLPIGTAQRMIGTLHHPYNRPRLNEAGTRVAEGYGVLQPRIGISHESAMRSRFARLWSGEPGIDPYAFAVSDPYQDGMDEGIFTGKGIFDADVFYRVLGTRIPDNRVLSHDLLEGGFLRSGLLPDIELVDGHPATFSAFQHRLHRWVRGDWQLLGWLRRQAKDRDGRPAPVDLTPLTRWQIVDNLRRSLLQPALFALLAAGLLVSWESGLGLLVVAFATLGIPILRALLAPTRLLRRPQSLVAAAAQSGLTLLTLPYQSALLLDAILRTLYRLIVSKRKLLEWVTSDEIDRSNPRKLLGFETGLALTVLFAALAVVADSPLQQAAGIAMAAIWAAAPAAVRFLDRSPAQEDDRLTAAEQQELRALALQIWQYYEDYATEAENWLPPDNVQFDPDVGVAHRTSPTNIGLLLACTVAARDFGFIDTPGMIERLERTVDTIERMDKWSGHLYNWYDTESLRPLPPLYVSTVDSGNLVGYYIAAKEGVAEWLREEYEERAGAPIAAGSKRQSSDRAGKHVAASSTAGPGKLRPVTVDMEASAELAEGRQDGRASRGGGRWRERGRAVIERLERLTNETDFRPLFDPGTKLFSLGYHAGTGVKEGILYDLLASEARQASFIAIAMGQVPASHWFKLGRAMTKVGKDTALVSWSGTMFEYLMPPLIMRTYSGTLWDSTYRAVVARQTEYARMRGVPMGISESGYYAFDYQMNYQYRAFGVPGLGFKRGLEQDLVLAPYATLMTLPYAPGVALRELRRMEEMGARGKYGYYEAIDCTRERLPDKQASAVIKSFMAHHQGMSLLTLGNVLLPHKMYDRFHADKRVKSAELLLQERIPERPALVLHAASAPMRMQDPSIRTDAPLREFDTPHTDFPETCVLSNGAFTTVLDAAGAGFARWEDRAVTRWREDPVADPWGSGIYIRDVERGDVWSAAYYPAGQEADEYAAQFSLDRVRYVRRDGELQTTMDICVSTEANAELRRLSISNRGDAARVLEITTYLEIVLAPPAADDAHQAFSKLFVQTEYDSEREVLLARRRPRTPDEEPLWAVHALAPCCETLGPLEYETDRACFVGRGHSYRDPQALASRLSGTDGAVLDPIFAARRRLTLQPGQTAAFIVVTGVAGTREEAVELPGRFCSDQQVERAFQLAWTRSRIELQHMHLQTTDASAYHMLASRVLYTPPIQSARAEGIRTNRLGQSGLWPLGISGDLPIVLVLVRDAAELPSAAVLIRGHEYLKRKGIAFDLVLLNETPGGYQQDLRDALQRTIEQTVQQMHGNRAGRIYTVNSDQLEEAQRALLLASARLTLRADGRNLKAQLRAAGSGQNAAALPLVPSASAMRAEHAAPPEQAAAGLSNQELEPPRDLVLWNGWGGFTPDGKEYRIRLHAGKHLPGPWSNVMANPNFGCMVTELGTGYTWFRNSREFKLTPWSNDPVMDPPGEACYVRDESTGEWWSPTPSPSREKPIGSEGSVNVSHGHGYSRFERSVSGIAQRMTIYVAREDPVKLIELNVRNDSGRTRDLSVTYYAEWVLGVRRDQNAPYVVTEWDAEAGCLFARNAHQETFRSETAFLRLYAGEGAIAWTADRGEFIGRNGSASEPAAMKRRSLSGAAGVQANSCGALQGWLTLAPGEERTLYVALGCGSSEAEAKKLARSYGDPSRCAEAYTETAQFWSSLLGQIQVATPSIETNVMLNGWLLYQALSCRMWARSAFYQAGGAYGFRDQLQDSLALLHVKPDLTRSQILLHCEHQYREGDVQHWWHAETDRGIRTKYSDDLLWLPYAVARYVTHTGDASVLQEKRPYLVSEPLTEEEHERYEATVVSDDVGTTYDHCLRAIDRALRLGKHGLPLMGIGDWNDGMNSVGDEGRGESVWLGWFLITVMDGFAPICERQGDAARADELRQKSRELAAAINEHAWDGEWYRRASTDHGTWLGTTSAAECRIDAIAQSWSVISGGAPQDRAMRAMQSFDRELVDRGHALAKLLTPAFDRTEPTPGYIQGYPPGIRENGGQYTHGVIWSIVAWALLGQGDQAFELFDMLNPVTHTASPGDIRTYVGEPYVMAADVYMSDPYKGRAGWTWYTGASGWMYQAGIEWIIGLRRDGDKLLLRPSIPADWPGFTAEYRFGRSVYAITVSRSAKADGASQVTVDGRAPKAKDADPSAMPYVKLVDDGKRHEVLLTL